MLPVAAPAPLLLVRVLLPVMLMLELPPMLEEPVVIVAGIVVYVPLTMVLAGATFEATFLAAAANMSMVILEGGLMTPTMPLLQCIRAEQ